MDKAIAASEPYTNCKNPVAPENFHVVRFPGSDKVLCDQCNRFYR